jgi:hypothetical protein
MQMNDNTKAADATEEEWEDIPTESQILFQAWGDEFIGEFNGWTETSSGIAQAHFVTPDGLYFVNVGWSLKQQLKDVKKGTLCRITYVNDQDTGQASPMMIFKVQTRRTTR